MYPRGSEVYTRADGESRRLTFGQHDPISAKQARHKAAQVIDDIKTGSKPVLDNAVSSADAVPAVADVAKRRMREHVMIRCKPTTVRHGRNLLDRHPAADAGSICASATLDVSG